MKFATSSKMYYFVFVDSLRLIRNADKTRSPPRPDRGKHDGTRRTTIARSLLAAIVGRHTSERNQLI